MHCSSMLSVRSCWFNLTVTVQTALPEGASATAYNLVTEPILYFSKFALGHHQGVRLCITTIYIPSIDQ